MPGVHAQPHGPFAAYVFCDDALGTNIAIAYLGPGMPSFEKWTLTRRFWQDRHWGADVHDLGWVPNRNLLVVTTSFIYGEGAVYLLDLERQEFVTLLIPEDCGSHILAINESSVTIGLNDCESPSPYRRVVLTFPQCNSQSQPAPSGAAER